MEHFSLDMQPMLDRYMDGDLDLNGLVQQYQETGTEGHGVVGWGHLERDTTHDPRPTNNGAATPRRQSPLRR